MTKKLEEIILEELFKLSGKIDKMQDEMKEMATKDDLKAFATKEDIKNMATKDDLKAFATKEDIKNMATKDDLKAFSTKTDLLNLEKRIDKKFDEQAKEIATMFHDSYVLNSKYRREMEERITKTTDKKIETLRREFLCKKS